MKLILKTKKPSRLFSFLFGVPRVRRIRRKSLMNANDVARARSLVHARLEHFNQYYNFTYNKVAIRNPRTRWGSCSNRGNLNFSIRILELPSELQDYLIVHELCHLKEFNHSSRFWDLVAEQVPNYQQLRQELRAIR